MIYIFITCPNKNEAREILQSLLNERLVACGSIFPDVESHYIWNGKIESSLEAKMILKTTKEFFNKIEKLVELHCSYKICEMAAVDTLLVSNEYKNWMEQVLL